MTTAYGALLVLALAMCGANASRSLKQATITDEDILNFALNLECLEAEFYSWAAYGYGLSAAELGNGPGSVGGQKALLSTAIQAYAEDIAKDEIAHVQFLRAALGPAAVACPALDVGPAFAAAANAALNTTLSPAFTPYGSDVLFLHGAFIFEDVGVTAYKGALPLITNKTYLSAAAGIMAVEGYHASAVRTLLSQVADQVVFPYGATVATIIQAISNLRDAAEGPNVYLDAGIVDPTASSAESTPAVSSDSLYEGMVMAPGMAPMAPDSVTSTYSVIIAPTDANAIAFSRTPAQVLDIVFLGGSMLGGFFPKGVNGVIN